jgi:hypothetical protein
MTLLEKQLSIVYVAPEEQLSWLSMVAAELEAPLQE